ncbi:MAG: BatD family protein [Candidatus Omnitrophota bacterium]|nr:BatD family protein [Candidatus Omnitrophota bacterium]
MKKIIILSVIFTSLFIATAFAQASIKAEVDKTIVTTDDAITYKLIITSSEKNIPTPQLPKFTGFRVISSAQSSTVSFTKGNIKTIFVYAFILAPTDIGKFKIEPSEVKIKNETFSTASFEIEVKQGKVKPKAEPEQEPSIPEETQPETEEQPQITL